MAHNATTGKDSSDSLKIGVRIRSARGEAGLTVDQVAQALGVNSRTVNGWQSGRSRPSYERLVELARLLGKPPSYFLEAAAA